jgi:hypothetical protein
MLILPGLQVLTVSGVPIRPPWSPLSLCCGFEVNCVSRPVLFSIEQKLKRALEGGLGQTRQTSRKLNFTLSLSMFLGQCFGGFGDEPISTQKRLMQAEVDARQSDYCQSANAKDCKIARTGSLSPAESIAQYRRPCAQITRPSARNVC